MKLRNKLKSRQKLEKILIGVLLFLVVAMGAYQLSAFVEKKEADEDIVYTAAIFKAPMQQSIEVLMLSKSQGQTSVIDNKNNKIQYSDIKNYKEENLTRYLNYHEKNPDLLEAEVIWRVNTDLDYEFYKKISQVENPQAITTVVNKYNKLDKDFVPDDLVLMEGEDQEFYLRKEAYEAFLKMRQAMNDLDLTIKVSSAFRTYDYQKSLYNKYVEEYGQEQADIFSARPGHSGHQLGLVVDVNDGNLPYTDFKKTEAYAWIKDNAHRYGFIVRYKANPELTGYQVEEWHLRYVGEKVAVDMYETNIHILEEYLDKHKSKLEEDLDE